MWCDVVLSDGMGCGVKWWDMMQCDVMWWDGIWYHLMWSYSLLFVTYPRIFGLLSERLACTFRIVSFPVRCCTAISGPHWCIRYRSQLHSVMLLNYVGITCLSFPFHLVCSVHLAHSSFFAYLYVPLSTAAVYPNFSSIINYLSSTSHTCVHSFLLLGPSVAQTFCCSEHSHSTHDDSWLF